MMKDSVERLIGRREVLQGTAAAVFGTAAFGDAARGVRAPVHEDGLEALGPEDHRPSRGRGREGADDLPDHPDRHQPGHLRIRRSARRREQDVRADAQEPAPRREPVQHRQALPEDQAVRVPRAAGRRGLGRRGRAVGPGGEGLRRADLPDAGRQVPRQDPLLRGHRQLARSQGLRVPPEGPHGPGVHLPEDGPRDRSAPGNPRHRHPARWGRRTPR